MYLSTLLCELCALSYKKHVNVPIFGFTSVKKYENHNACVYVFKNEKCIVLAFRGSNDIRDWVSNINTSSHVTPYGTIHSGFFNEYMKLESLFDVDLKDSRPVFITGHSLGGALAILAGCHYQHLDPVVVTFGSPRVGCSDFNKSCSTLRYIRWVNGNDKVCRLPLRKYFHCGLERKLEFPWYKRIFQKSPHHVYNYLKGIRSLNVTNFMYEDLIANLSR